MAVGSGRGCVRCTVHRNSTGGAYVRMVCRKGEPLIWLSALNFAGKWPRGLFWNLDARREQATAGSGFHDVRDLDIVGSNARGRRDARGKSGLHVGGEARCRERQRHRHRHEPVPRRARV